MIRQNKLLRQRRVLDPYQTPWASVQLGPPGRHNRRGKGTFYWNGAAATAFWVDPNEGRLSLCMANFVLYRYFST
jgi:hypothetical protein